MEQQYKSIIEDCINNGYLEDNRTGIKAYTLDETKILTSRVLKLSDSEYELPIIQGKKIHLKSVLHELLWFISGDTNIKYLKDNGVNIWNEWADEDGRLGAIYGAQWRGGPDNLKCAIEDLISNPTSRRIIVNSWNVAHLAHMALPPCHLLYQFTVVNNKLSIKVYMRSTDIFLGLPFNMTSYALLLIMVSRLVNIEPNKVEIIMAMPHVYENHLEATGTYMEQLKEMYKEPFCHPTVTVSGSHNTIDDFKYEDFTFDYESMPVIKAPIAV